MPKYRILTLFVSFLMLMLSLAYGFPNRSVEVATALSEPVPLWQEITDLPKQKGLYLPLHSHQRLFWLNAGELQHLLQSAPSERIDQPPAILELPLPDGSLQSFYIERYAMLEPELAQKNPHLYTIKGYGVTDKRIKLYLDWTDLGLNAIILSPQGIFFVAPYKRGNQYVYVSSDSSLMGSVDFNEGLPSKRLNEPIFQEFLRQNMQNQIRALSETADISLANATLRTYRLAVAVTGEYTQYYGGKAEALSALITLVNQANAFYEREASIRFTLVADIEDIIFTHPATDPFSSDKWTAASQNTAVLNTYIGVNNYDVGHVLGQFAGGYALISVACDNANKAVGVTGDIYLQHTPTILRAFIHELGHQFGALHTFNAQDASFCNMSSRQALGAYEPGSGSTIMSYSTYCDSQNLQAQWDVVFHTNSFESVINHVNSYPTCGTTQNINQAPVVDAGATYTIPAQTRFELTGMATDPDGDSLMYSWEQYDLGNPPNTAQLPNLDDGQRPIFRSYLPQTTPNRAFPSLVESRMAAIGELLPTTARALTFRFTARDNEGGVSYDTTTLTVVNTDGPFAIITPTHFAVWQPGSEQTIMWDVAGTDTPPISCPQVDISLSLNGGRDFDTVLGQNLPNNGSAAVTIPNLSSSMALIKVACSTNIFFAVPPTSVGICSTYEYDDQEGSTPTWYIENPQGDNSWQRQTDGGYSGTHYWGVSSSPSILNTHSYLISPQYEAIVEEIAFSFVHRNYMEVWLSQAMDAGVVEIQVNNGFWQSIDEEQFLRNGYNYTVRNDFGSNLANQPAFSGIAPHYFESTVDLSDMVEAGDTFRLRFRHANDSLPYNGIPSFGWHVDDVFICGGQLSANQPPPTVGASYIYLPMVNRP